MFIFRVKGIDGLRVADGSVMRHLTSGNTNAPCIMIGEKAADLIRGKDTVEDFRKKIKQLNIWCVIITWFMHDLYMQDLKFIRKIIEIIMPH